MISEEKDLKLLEKRFLELDQKAFSRNIPMFSHFLNLHEYQVFLSLKSKLSCYIQVFGGYAGAERVMVMFAPDSFYEESAMPIQCLKISPVSVKFAEVLTHRDYLGAILNLGIERSTLGDIIVGEKEAYLFCHEKVASFILSECIRIRHTSVIVTASEFSGFSVLSHSKEIQGTVASLRIDSFLSVALRKSRNQCVQILKEEKVFCNNRKIVSAKFVPQPGDIISVRGVGRFQLKDDEIRQTKKGRHSIHILVQ